MDKFNLVVRAARELAQVVNDEILCLHSDTVEQDYQQVINWIKQQNGK